MAKKLAFDRLLFTVVLVLTIFGLVMVYSASAAAAVDSDSLWSSFLVKQGAAAVLGLLAMAVVMHVDYRTLSRPVVVYALLSGVLVLLVVVLFAPTLNETRRWLFLGPVSVQPSELAKLALVPFLAYQIDKKLDRVNEPQLLVPCAVVSSLLAGLILLQPDLGTAVLLMATAGAVLFLAGLSWRWLIGAGAVLLPALWLLVINVPYRRARLLSFLHPEADPQGSGYQALQSLIAIGSGGLFGRGLGQGVQKLHYLPHPQSDFIYSIVAEELGLLGALTVVVLFSIFLWRGVAAGWSAPDAFGRYLGWGFTLVVAVQALLNIGVAVAMLPTKGIPLPFVSYGGSSLVVSLTACGVILNVSQHG